VFLTSWPSPDPIQVDAGCCAGCRRQPPPACGRRASRSVSSTLESTRLRAALKGVEAGKAPDPGRAARPGWSSSMRSCPNHPGPGFGVSFSALGSAALNGTAAFMAEHQRSPGTPRWANGRKTLRKRWPAVVERVPALRTNEQVAKLCRTSARRNPESGAASTAARWMLGPDSTSSMRSRLLWDGGFTVKEAPGACVQLGGDRLGNSLFKHGRRDARRLWNCLRSLTFGMKLYPSDPMLPLCPPFGTSINGSHRRPQRQHRARSPGET